MNYVQILIAIYLYTADTAVWCLKISLASKLVKMNSYRAVGVLDSM